MNKKLFRTSLKLLLFLCWHIMLYAPNQGLVNQNGNDCFFSSSFQCLSQIKPFIDFFKDNKFFRDGPIQSKFYEFIQNMKTQSALTKAFRKFITSESTTGNFFLHQMSEEQQDAQEFLSLLLQYLIGQTPYHTAIANNLRKILETKIPDGATQQRIIDRVMEIMNTDMQQIESLNVHLKSVIAKRPPDQVVLLSNIPFEGHEKEWAEINEQIIKLKELYKIFNIILHSTLTCLTCSYSSITLGVERSLSLPIPEKKLPISLSDCFEAFKTPEILTGSEQWRCPQCNKKVDARKQFSIAHFPQILIVNLKRFSYGGLANKISTAVQFPILLSIVAGEKTLKFNLFGIVCHGGGTGGGHYWAYVKDRTGDNKWRRYNDSRVSDTEGKASMDNFVTTKLANEGIDNSVPGYHNGTPYVFFYEIADDSKEDQSKQPVEEIKPPTPPSPKAPAKKLDSDDITSVAAKLPALTKNLQGQKQNFVKLAKYLKSIRDLYRYALVAHHFDEYDSLNVIEFITHFNELINGFKRFDIKTLADAIAIIKLEKDAIYPKIKNLYAVKKLSTPTTSSPELDNLIMLYGLFDNALDFCTNIVDHLPSQEALQKLLVPLPDEAFGSKTKLLEHLKPLLTSKEIQKLTELHQKTKQCEDALTFAIPEIGPASGIVQCQKALEKLAEVLKKLAEHLKILGKPKTK